MKDLLKIGLLAIGGFYAYTRFWNSDDDTATAEPAADAGTATSQTTTQAPPNSTPPPPASTPPAAAALDIAGLVAKEAQANGFPAGALMTFDQWNYFYTAIRGIAGPDFNALPGTRSRDYRMTVSEWYNLAAPFGVA